MISIKNCVYRILNVIDNKVYIGSTIDSERRKLQHFNQLEKGIHYNKYLQNAYDKYGKDAFIFEVIEHDLKEDELIKREQHYIRLFNSTDPKFGYNLSQYANQPDSRKFIKTYTVKLRNELEKNPISTSAIALFFLLQIYLEKYTNRVALPNGKDISNKEILKIFGGTRQRIAKLLNELEEHNFIKKTKRGRNRQIYLNPYITTAGGEVKEDIYNMFKCNYKTKED